MNLGKLEKIKDLRKVWPHEATDFTPWLAQEDNISLLSDAVGIDISVDETESNVGSFNVDIYATETDTGNKIIVENQLEDTNHDHLGKIITYASGKDAKFVIWIVKKAREEHRHAIEWLNNHTDNDIAFFLIEIELWTINGSDPAVKFNVVEKPNDWAKEIKKVDSTLNDTEKLKLDYWTSFADYAFADAAFSKVFKRRKPSTDHWYSVSMGSSEYHMSFLMNTQKNILAVEIGIHDNKELFHEFYAEKDKIEAKAGVTLDWRELPERKASRILYETNVDFKDKDSWNKQFDWIMEYGVKIAKAFKSV